MSDTQTENEVISGLKVINAKTYELTPSEIPQKVLEGRPTFSETILWISEDESRLSGIWSSTVGKWECVWPWHETCHLLEGQLEMIDHLGKSVILIPGDMFHCIKGAKHIFNVLQPVRKLMFLFHDSSIPDTCADLIEKRGSQYQ